LALEPSVFIQEMNKAGLRRAYLVFDSKNNTVQVSHPLFEQMAQSIVNDKRDFLGHEAIFIELGQQSNALLTAFIQKSVRGIPQVSFSFFCDFSFHNSNDTMIGGR